MRPTHTRARSWSRCSEGVKEAAEILGVEKSNFVRDYANKPEFPAPIAELASGRFWLRSDIERYLQKKNERIQPRVSNALD